MSILIVYYSRTGYTKKIAEAIARASGADLEEILSKKNRKGLFGYLKSGKEAARKELAEIEEVKKNVLEYDIVIIGTPVWVGNMTSPIRTYLNNNLGRFKQVAFFSTQGSIKDQKVFNELREILGKDPLSVLKMSTKEVSKGEFNDKIDKFLKEIKSN
ncbi:NAD(P)H-dependent oxidoreductase [bacterium]|nr:NAD(P)H-dependent oxidoreductase [bacterium]